MAAFSLKPTLLTLINNHLFYRLLTSFPVNYAQAIIPGRDVIDLKIIGCDPSPLFNHASTHVRQRNVAGAAHILKNNFYFPVRAWIGI